MTAIKQWAFGVALLGAAVCYASLGWEWPLTRLERFANRPHGRR